jgi:GNAT superfamily N-acetyltransferase
LSTLVKPAVDLKVLARSDWPILRAARLDALRDSPHAFMARYEDEEDLSQADWEHMFDDASWIVAKDAETVIGLARCIAGPQSTQRYIESIWVAKPRRRKGVFRAMLRAVCEVEERLGAAELLLWVFEDNNDAQEVYKAVGFEPTGDCKPLPDIDRVEVEYRLRIRLSAMNLTSRTTKIVKRRTAKPCQAPLVQPEEVYDFSSAANVVHAT